MLRHIQSCILIYMFSIYRQAHQALFLFMIPEPGFYFFSLVLSCPLSSPMLTVGSSSPSGITSTSTRVMPSSPHPTFSLSNIRQHIPEALDFSNQLVWRELLIPVLKGHQVYDHVDDSLTPLSVDDPGYAQWLQIDNFVLSWIQSTIFRDIL